MIPCPKLPPFSPGDPNDVENAFSGAAEFVFSQPWLNEPHPSLQQGSVRLGHGENALIGLAMLNEKRTFTHAKHDHELLCEMGDVFEIFLQESGARPYYEFHISPNGKRLQFLWPENARQAQKKFSLEHFIVKEPLFQFQTVVSENIWRVLFSIPLAFSESPVTSKIERRRMVSFGRYDYVNCATRERIISSTSKHTALDFHRPEEWTEILLS